MITILENKKGHCHGCQDTHKNTISNCGATHCSYVMSCCKESLIQRTEMHILRVDKMCLLFKMSLWPHQRGTVWKNKPNKIFLMIPCESMWVHWFGHHMPAKLRILPETITKNASFSQAQKTWFLEHIFQNAVLQRQIKIFTQNLQKIIAKFQ